MNDSLNEGPETTGDMKKLAFRLARESVESLGPIIDVQLSKRSRDAAEIVRVMTGLELAERLWAGGTKVGDAGLRRASCVVMEFVLQEIRTPDSELFLDFFREFRNGLAEYEQTLAERQKEIAK